MCSRSERAVLWMCEMFVILKFSVSRKPSTLGLIMSCGSTAKRCYLYFLRRLFRSPEPYAFIVEALRLKLSVLNGFID